MKKNIVLSISVACGVLALVITRVYIAAVNGEIADKKAALDRRYGTIEVLCLLEDTPAGTVIEKNDLGERTVPALGMRGQALTKERLSDVVGRKLLMSRSSGEVLFWADVEGGDPSLRSLSHDVKRHMRAMSINVSPSASVSGMIKPNDHVDVIGTFAFSNNPKDVASLTILQNVLVLATGRETAKSRFHNVDPRQDSYSLVTLEVSPREAEMLAFTEQMKGRLILTLRNKNDVSFEKELPQVDFEKVRLQIESLNLKRQQRSGGAFK